MSLLALSPERLAAALPSLSARRRSGSWPVGLLPMELLAADVAAFGYRYKRGSGFSSGAVRVEGYDVASTAALILNMTADSFPSAKPLGEVWFDAADELVSHADRLHVETHDAIDDYELAEAVYTPQAHSSTHLAAYYRAFTESAEGAALAREHDAYGARFEEYADAVRSTARDLKASPSAQTTFLKALRSALPAPEEPTADEHAALAFLASLDALPTLSRSALPALYAEAGSPGGLTASDLRDLANDRWGIARPSNGTYIYRPAKASAA
jgi:hypothetical protein